MAMMGEREAWLLTSPSPNVLPSLPLVNLPTLLLTTGCTRSICTIAMLLVFWELEASEVLSLPWFESIRTVSPQSIVQSGAFEGFLCAICSFLGLWEHNEWNWNRDVRSSLIKPPYSGHWRTSWCYLRTISVLSFHLLACESSVVWEEGKWIEILSFRIPPILPRTHLSSFPSSYYESKEQLSRSFSSLFSQQTKTRPVMMRISLFISRTLRPIRV